MGVLGLDATLRMGGEEGAAPGPLPDVWTNLFGPELLVPDGGTQQRPQGTKELPPRPVLDRQEDSHVLLDALSGQPPDLQEEETRAWGEVKGREAVEGGAGGGGTGFTFFWKKSTTEKFFKVAFRGVRLLASGIMSRFNPA